MTSVQSRKKIGVFFDAPTYEGYPFQIKEYYEAYHELGKLLADRGAEFRIVRTQESFLGGNRFSHSWVFDGTTFRERNEPVELDLIYDKGHFKGDAGSTLLNDVAIDVLCTDKRVTAKMFPEISPKTFEVASRKELEAMLAGWTGEKVVAKPIDGHEGKGVVIGSPAEVLAAEHSFPLLVQEFIDISGGIPGFCDKPHDYRTVIYNGVVGVTYIRTAPPGSFIANVSRGGSEIQVPADKRPAEAKAVVEQIDRRMAERFPKRVYSIDLGRDKSGRWYLIELNAKPAILPARFGPDHERSLRLLADALLA